MCVLSLLPGRYALHVCLRIKYPQFPAGTSQLLLCLLEVLNVTLYRLCILNMITAQTHTKRRKLPNLITGHAGIVNIPHVQMSICVNSQPNQSEHTN